MKGKLPSLGPKLAIALFNPKTYEGLVILPSDDRGSLSMVQLKMGVELSDFLKYYPRFVWFSDDIE